MLLPYSVGGTSARGQLPWRQLPLRTPRLHRPQTSRWYHFERECGRGWNEVGFRLAPSWWRREKGQSSLNFQLLRSNEVITLNDDSCTVEFCARSSEFILDANARPTRNSRLLESQPRQLGWRSRSWLVPRQGRHCWPSERQLVRIHFQPTIFYVKSFEIRF